MNVLHDVLTVFSTYSAIPVPSADIQKGSSPRVPAYLPLVGLAVALAFIGASRLLYPFGQVLRGAALVIVPVLVTGGIHMDGFLDVCDALSSWQSKEKRLDILKDVHVGAFAVIRSSLYFIALMGLYAESSHTIALPLACGFILSRCAAMVMLCTLPNARGEGMLFSFQYNIDAKTVLASAAVSAAIVCGLALITAPLPAALAIVAELMALWRFRRLATTKFGGITGDLAGYCIQMQELVWAIVIIAVWRIT
ncbi:MAG: adenosylcobinamide-GDP ribazoletransferase [Eubacteriales bacterium]|jgi:adenosylcobinamide-GDP ribazoletransferase|nr:adenosylcobinamide-GDP ribazoletransferase [Eubacteriales bacterium]MDD4104302.1 adenosylcobinamide-GDP ribazoletransferase [Eubacteriales bacterium]MDD4709751.1 adenosylcobinamide-GDP ribazoletransferase [Eubacteriales bacterium]NLO14883.1 adenosylcobinamide-GDP ribazoletransferase [Clostridiales bacterium]